MTMKAIWVMATSKVIRAKMLGLLAAVAKLATAKGRNKAKTAPMIKPMEYRVWACGNYSRAILKIKDNVKYNGH